MTDVSLYSAALQRRQQSWPMGRQKLTSFLGFEEQEKRNGGLQYCKCEDKLTKIQEKLQKLWKNVSVWIL